MEKKVIEMISIKVTLDEVCEEHKAIRENNKIIYKDNAYKVTFYNDEILRMTRENEEYLISLEFIAGQKTKGNCLLKTDNVSMDIDIMTNDIVKTDNYIMIEYTVLTTNKKVIYKLEV